MLRVRNDRNMMNLPNLAAADIWIVYDLDGIPSEYPSAERNIAVREAKKEEVKLSYEELETAKAVKKAVLFKKIMPLSSHLHLFTIEKFPTSGKHEKFKILLVSHGDQQDALLHPDRSFPAKQLLPA